MLIKVIITLGATRVEKRRGGKICLIFVIPSGEGALASIGRNHRGRSHRIKYEISRLMFQLSQPPQPKIDLEHEQKAFNDRPSVLATHLLERAKNDNCHRF
jgi:hypothetical protein